MTEATIRKKIRELYRLRLLASKAKALSEELRTELVEYGVVDLKPTRSKEPGLSAFVMESEMTSVQPEDLEKALPKGKRKELFKALKVNLGDARKIFGKVFIDSLAQPAGTKKSIVIKPKGEMNKAEAVALAELSQGKVKRRVRL